MDRLSDRAVVWSALVHAHDYAEMVSESYNHDNSHATVVQHRKMMAAYDRVALKYFGATVSGLRNAQLTKATGKPQSIVALLKDNS